MRSIYWGVLGAVAISIAACAPPSARPVGSPGAPAEESRARVILGDVALAPLYWNVAPVLALEGVKGIPVGGGSSQTWNFFEWDKR